MHKLMIKLDIYRFYYSILHCWCDICKYILQIKNNKEYVKLP